MVQLTYPHSPYHTFANLHISSHIHSNFHIITTCMVMAIFPPQHLHFTHTHLNILPPKAHFTHVHNIFILPHHHFTTPHYHLKTPHYHHIYTHLPLWLSTKILSSIAILTHSFILTLTPTHAIQPPLLTHLHPRSLIHSHLSHLHSHNNFTHLSFTHTYTQARIQTFTHTPRSIPSLTIHLKIHLHLNSFNILTHTLTPSFSYSYPHLHLYTPHHFSLFSFTT